MSGIYHFRRVLSGFLRPIQNNRLSPHESASFHIQSAICYCCIIGMVRIPPSQYLFECNREVHSQAGNLGSIGRTDFEHTFEHRQLFSVRSLQPLCVPPVNLMDKARRPVRTVRFGTVLTGSVAFGSVCLVTFGSGALVSFFSLIIILLLGVEGQAGIAVGKGNGRSACHSRA